MVGDAIYARRMGMPEFKGGVPDSEEWGEKLVAAIKNGDTKPNNFISLGGWFTEYNERDQFARIERNDVTVRKVGDPEFSQTQGMPAYTSSAPAGFAGIQDPDEWGRKLAEAFEKNPSLANDSATLAKWFKEFSERDYQAILRQATKERLRSVGDSQSYSR